MERRRALVIGAGVGGLAAAQRLAVRGFDVTVLERQASPGGMCAPFAREGFSFDGAATIVTAPGLLDELWRTAGRERADDVELIAVDPFFTLCFADGSTFRHHADREALRDEVRRLAAPDLAGFDRFLANSEVLWQYAFRDMAHMPFDQVGQLVRSLPHVLRHQPWRSVGSRVGDYVQDPRLRVALSFHTLLLVGDPFATTAFYCLSTALQARDGMHYVRGGTGALINALVRLIEAQGVRCCFEADVTRIVVDGGRAVGVELASGMLLASDIVVANADAKVTYGELLADAERRRWTDRRLQRLRYTPGVAIWYFGTRCSYPDVAQHTVLIGERYEDVFKAVSTEGALDPQAPIYLHRATASDPSLAPDGGDTFYAMMPVPNLAAGLDWTDTAEPWRAGVQARLEAGPLPGLGERIVVSELRTPVDFEARWRAPYGSAFSIAAALFQTAWFRPHNRSEDVAGLYLVGASTHPSAGLPGVLSSARILDEVVPDPMDVPG